MSITAAMVKELREKTGVGMMKCKQALQEVDGNLADAEKLLRKQGAATAAKKAGRTTREGIVDCYIHDPTGKGAKIGVILEVLCETDFTARSDDFRELVHNVAMHIAAAAPRHLRREEVTEEALAEEREIAREQALRAGKPEKVVDKIVDGKLQKYFAENCLLEQPYVRASERTVGELVNEAVSRIGENIQVRRFVRFALGEEV
jgi:elongation factor Ts